MKCSMELLEQLKGADTDRSIVLATSCSLTFGGGWRGNAFEICFACGCRAILLEGKSDKRLKVSPVVFKRVIFLRRPHDIRLRLFHLRRSEQAFFLHPRR